MKKIYLLLALLFTGLQPTFAQYIWHSDLGTPPTGSVSLEWNTTYYAFDTYDGNEFGRTGEIWDSLSEQLLSAGVDWMTINSIEAPEDGHFEVCLTLQRNTGSSPRTVYFGGYAVTQKAQNEEPGDGPVAVLPADRHFSIYQGEKISILIHGTSNGSTYDVLQHYAEDDIEIFDTFIGTGGDYVYTAAFPEGDFSFGFRNSNFSVSYSDTATNRYAFSATAISAAAEGGIYRLYFSSYTKSNGTSVSITKNTDLSFLNQTILNHNAGKIDSWKPRMRLSYGYDEQMNKAYLQVTCPPNLTDEFSNSVLGLMNSSGQKPTVSQAPNGGVQSPLVTYRLNKAKSKIEATLEYSQPFVTYTLNREGVVKQSMVSGSGQITLTAPAESGYYQVFASYSEGGRSASAELNGVRYNSDMLALDDDKNWILSRTYNADNHGDADEIQITYDVGYYDGLGYASHNMQIAASGDGQKDIIQPVVYDGLYREAFQYLPYALNNNNGQCDEEAILHQENFYRAKYKLGTTPAYAYIETEYEPSALGRTLRTHKPGMEYRSAQRSQQIAYMGNGAQTILCLRVDPEDRSLNADGYYAANELVGIQTTDEDRAVIITYKDKDGRTVYENRQLRNGNTIENVITYYAYDDCGRLSWVVTPKGSDMLTTSSSFSPDSDFTKQNCYVYFYDEWSRLYEKRMPGREPEYMVYNQGDRLMMSQDGLMRERKQWMIYEYDGLGRVTTQKLATNANDSATTHKTLQDEFDTYVIPQLYISSTAQIVRQYAYDRHPATMPAALAFEQIPDMTYDLTGIEPETLLDTLTTGLPTYEKLAVLTDSDGINVYHERAYYYDYKGRVIQSVERDFDGNILRTTNRYDLIGNLLAQRESYTQGSKTDRLNRTFEYDSRNRLTKETAQFNNGEQAVVTHAYDDLGQLVGANYGTGAYAIHETMEYNLQGWLTHKNSELFEMKLRYYDPEPYYGGDAYYTGNISEWWWLHKNVNGSWDAENNTYIFHYDDLARLNDSRLTYNESEDVANEFTERGITYDKNSNILTLNRSSLTSEDAKDYRFSYNGNQRIKELNSNSDYRYDANGNIRQDAMTGFYIYYNFLNLPSVIYTEGDMGLYYAYLADGTKVAAASYAELYPVRYAGSLVYDDGSFESASFGGGRIVGTNNGANSEVHYFLTDHLGSTRVVAKVTASGRQDIDRKDYYPFGKVWSNPDMPASDNRYTSGKEQQYLRYCAVDYADFGARFYDSNTGIFLQQDPLAEKVYRLTSYGYCNSNPINLVDPTGMETADEEAQRKAEQEANEWRESSIRQWRIWVNQLQPESLDFSVITTTHQSQESTETNSDTSSFDLNRAFKRLNEGGMHEFNSELEAYVYMWLASHKKEGGKWSAYKEHAAYILKNGKTILLPVVNNATDQSHNYFQLLSPKSGNFYLPGYRSPVVGYTHTHPHPGATTHHISDADFTFAAQFPSLTHKVIATGGQIYQIWGNNTIKLIGKLQ